MDASLVSCFIQNLKYHSGRNGGDLLVFDHGRLSINVLRIGEIPSLLILLQNGPGVIDLFLSRHRDSGIIFQLNSNLVIVKPDLSRCLKLILCHNFSKMMFICNCIVHVSRHIMLFLLSL